MSLISLINIATKEKPPMGEPCNNCGWCCLTEVCPTGKILYGEQIPCAGIVTTDGKHLCKVVVDDPDMYGDMVAIGTGCDAMTQSEVLASLVDPD